MSLGLLAHEQKAPRGYKKIKDPKSNPKPPLNDPKSDLLKWENDFNNRSPFRVPRFSHNFLQPSVDS